MGESFSVVQLLYFYILLRLLKIDIFNSRSNIFDSMRKYVGQRDKLQLTIDDLKQKLTKGSLGREAIGDILALESQLDDFVPTEQSQIDKVFDGHKVKEIVALIEKANALLE